MLDESLPRKLKNDFGTDQNLNSFQQYYPIIYIAVGIAALLYALLKSAAKVELKKTGVQVEGIVFKQDYQPNTRMSYNSPLIKDQIFIRFLTIKNEWITAPINQEFATFYSSQYKDGEKVTVYYDKDDPSIFYVSTKQSEFQGRFFLAFLGLFFILIGIYKYLV